MKILNTFEELLEYLLYCPFCKKKCRQIDFNKCEIIKNEDNVEFISKRLDQSIKFKFTINCISNKIENIINSLTQTNTYQIFEESIFASCKECDSTWSEAIINFNLENIIKIQIEKDSIKFVDNDVYYITLLYYSNSLLYSMNEQNTYQFKLMKLDLENPKQIINKIKTLLLFS